MIAEINGVNLYYNERGDKNGIPFIFIHAFPFNSSMWAEQVAMMAAQYRTITWDIRGFGQSICDDHQYTLEFFVDDLIGLMDFLKIDQAILCGLSMGGYIALRAAEKAPERIKALVLADTRPETDTNEARIKRAEVLRILKDKDKFVFTEGFMKGVFWEDTFNRLPEVIQKAHAIITSNSEEGIAGGILALISRTDTSHALSHFKFPTLILVGEHDATTPPIAAQNMHELIEGSEMHVIPFAAHISNMENPIEFNFRLQNFLATL